MIKHCVGSVFLQVRVLLSLCLAKIKMDVIILENCGKLIKKKKNMKKLKQHYVTFLA